MVLVSSSTAESDGVHANVSRIAEPGWWTVAGDVARLERLRGIIARLPADVDRVAVVSHWGLINLMHDDDPTPNDPVWEEMPFARLPNTGVVRLARKVSFLNDPQ